ncbi:hypothetical protein ABN763_16105 [Spongiivirga sp. MCCC 1A20706]
MSKYLNDLNIEGVLRNAGSFTVDYFSIVATHSELITASNTIADNIILGTVRIPISVQTLSM